MREITRPPTARCVMSMYISFLLSEPKSPSCCHLAEIVGISHDSANRFLLREQFT
ncbi:MAG: IS701 family transposase, partial [Methylobacter sp.]|nr:IS701 family transposase [Methylobacter sp.]MDP2429404.1 IS701 family transposase [Methylobacter sp.]MDP3054573.1 IS701 family transposase [Methylobacter sp.]MDZ4219305.1 IS701 family transposase [Methylobacter sp.]